VDNLDKAPSAGTLIFESRRAPRAGPIFPFPGARGPGNGLHFPGWKSLPERLSGVVGLFLGVLIGFLGLVVWSRYLVGTFLADLHQFFPRGSLAWNMVHTNFWIISYLVCTLLAVLGRAARNAHLLKYGIEEYRTWRSSRR
jgi:hypothetical protein